MLKETSSFRDYWAEIQRSGRKEVWRFFADLCHQTAVLFFIFVVDNKVLKEAEEEREI